jgi:hypothetical protein
MLSILTPEHQSIIENTASTFQLSPEDLSGAIDSLRKRRNLGPISDHEEAFIPATLSRPEDRPLQTAFSYFEMDPVNDDAEFGFSVEDQLLPTADGHFGFHITPAAWSNCFANLLPNDNPPTLQGNLGKSLTLGTILLYRYSD